MATNIFKQIYDKLSSIISTAYTDLKAEQIIFRDEAISKDFRFSEFIIITPDMDNLIQPFVSGELRQYTVLIKYHVKNTLIDYDDLTSFGENLKDTLMTNRCVLSGEWHFLAVQSVDYNPELADDVNERYFSFYMTVTMDRGAYQA